MRSRNWVFTLNRADNDLAALKAQVEELVALPGVQYCSWQVERGEVGTLHVQGYLQVQSPKSLDPGMKRMQSSAHWEVRRGTHEQAKEYTRKEESRVEGPFEFGDERKDQGHRADLDAVCEGSTLLRPIHIEVPHIPWQYMPGGRYNPILIEDDGLVFDSVVSRPCPGAPFVRRICRRRD